MLLRELFLNTKKIIIEGGNLEVPGGHQAQHINLKTVPRHEVVASLNTLLHSINNAYQAQYKTPLWSKDLIKKQTFLSGSSLHLFNTKIPDDEFVKHKPLVGDVDTQVNKEQEANLQQFLQSMLNQKIGNATFLGFQRGNEQFSSLWALDTPAIKIQIDLEFVEFENDEPTQWAQFSHSSNWEDLSQGIKGVFHKYFMRALTSGTTSQKYIQMKTKIKGPITDNDVSFAVSSKQGGGMRRAYEPVIDPETGQPKLIDGIPLVQEIPTATSHYEQNLDKQFEMLFKQAPQKEDQKLLWSFVGCLQLANKYLSDEDKQRVATSFESLLYGPAAQGLYKGAPERDKAEKGVAFNTMLSTLKIPDADAVKAKAEQDAQAYYQKYKVAESLNEAEVKAQLRKGMPHLRALKPADLLDLLDEIHDGNGAFKLENIPLNVKVDGFGGRFGKDADGRPFMGTSNTPPRYEAGFVKYHQQKGTTDPDILGRAHLFDKLFEEMMDAVRVVDEKLGPDFLVNKQITCEVLFLPFATETPEGKLKFVGIHYDRLPEGVELALVPFRVADASTGEDIPDARHIVKKITSIGQQDRVMFINNALTQKHALDVTAIVPPVENIEQLKSMLASGKLAAKREVKSVLEPVALALEKAIIEDPNIVGKDMLGKDYEGIVLNTRLGPVKVTSQEQRNVIADKQAAKANARTERPRGQNKTAVVAIGSFVGHIGHEQLFDYTIQKAAEVGGDPYLFIGNAEGKNDPIPVPTKVETWHKMYPEYSKNISSVMQGGSLIQKIKHELINPLPGKPPRYDSIIIMVGEDQANMPIANALMKAVNKFQGYEHVKVSLESTPRGTGMSFTKLRNILKDPNATPDQQYQVWAQGFDEAKLGKDWILHLMDLTRRGMGISQNQLPQEPVNIKDANKVIREMRAKEFLSELSVKPAGSMHQHHIDAGQGATLFRDVGGYDRIYHLNRMMMATAMADGRSKKAVDMPDSSWYEKYNVAFPYTDIEHMMVNQALATVPSDAGELEKRSKSAEPKDTNKTSAVAKPKRNKYGV